MSMNMTSWSSIGKVRFIVATTTMVVSCVLVSGTVTMGQPKAGQPKAGQPKGTTPKASAPTPVAEPAAKATNELPKTFRPAGKRHPSMDVQETWVFTPYAEKRDERIAIQKLNQLRSTGNFSSGEDEKKKELKVIRDNIRYRLAQFTLPENRESVHELRTKLLIDLRNNGRKADSAREVRQEMLDTIIREVPELLKYHFVARLNGVILLTELNEFEADSNAQIPAVPLTLAHDLLIKILGDTTQPDAIRLYGCLGLERILMGVPDLKLAIRYKVTDALVAQVDGSKTGELWFQFRLTQALGACTSMENQDHKLIVPQALGRILVDESRPLTVRIEAAYSIARLSLNEKIDLKQVSAEVGRLAVEGAEAFLREPKSTESVVRMIKLYVVFKPIEETEKNRGLLIQTQQKKALQKYKADVDEMFKKVLPVIKATAIQKDPKAVAKPLADLNTYLKTLPPQQKSFVEDMPNLRAKAEVQAAK